MVFWQGEEIRIYYEDGEMVEVTVVDCERGHRGWKLHCRPLAPHTPDLVVWDSEGAERPERDPVVGIRRTGVMHPLNEPFYAANAQYNERA